MGDRNRSLYQTPLNPCNKFCVLYIERLYIGNIDFGGSKARSSTTVALTRGDPGSGIRNSYPYPKPKTLEPKPFIISTPFNTKQTCKLLITQITEPPAAAALGSGGVARPRELGLLPNLRFWVESA